MEDQKIHKPFVATIAVNVAVNGEFEDLPNSATIQIGRDEAIRLLAIAAMVKEHDWYQVEDFDYRVAYDLRTLDERDGEDARPVSVDGPTIHVGNDRIWFSALPKHGEVEMTTEEIDLSALAQHFGLPMEQRQSQLAAFGTNRLLMELRERGLLAVVLSPYDVHAAMEDQDLPEAMTALDRQELARRIVASSQTIVDHDIKRHGQECLQSRYEALRDTYLAEMGFDAPKGPRP